MDNGNLNEKAVRKLERWRLGEPPSESQAGRPEGQQPEKPEEELSRCKEEFLEMFEKAGPLSEEECAPEVQLPVRKKPRAPEPELLPESFGPPASPRPSRPIQEPEPKGFRELEEDEEVVLEFRKGEGVSEASRKETDEAKKSDPSIASAKVSWYEWEGPLEGVPPLRAKPQRDWQRVLDQDPEEVLPERVFSVGVDTGTSGLRVASKSEFTEEYCLFDFGENKAGGSRFSFPALIGVDGDRVLFGNDAVDVPWQRRFTSFKAGMLFLDQAKGMTERWQRIGLPYAESFASDKGPKVPEFLYSMSVAKALSLSLPELLNGLEDTYLTFVVGAPSDGWREDVSPRFHRAFSAGVLLAGCMAEAQNTETLVRCFAHAWKEAESLSQASEAEARIHVRHETQLSVSSLRKFFQNGRTFIIGDIGATTTEVAMIRVDFGRLNRWVSRSLPVGVDQADLRALSESRSKKDLVARRVDRMQKRPGALKNQHTVQLAADLEKQVAGVLRQAISLNPDKPSWEEVHVSVFGGGANIQDLGDVFKNVDVFHDFVKRPIHHPLKLLPASVRGASEKPPAREETPELVTVLGAATPVFEEIPYSAEKMQVVLPEVDENPYWELEKQARSRWL